MMDWILIEPSGREGQFSPTGCLSSTQLHMNLGWKAEHEDSHRMKIGKQERKSEKVLITIYHLDPRERPDPILKAFEASNDEATILPLRKERTSSFWE